MAVTLRDGPVKWSASRDDNGDRTYKATFIVEGDKTDGPANVLNCEGLPQPGDFWIIDADNDLWASCKQNATVTPKVSAEPNTQWEVEITFSTKGDDKRCKDMQIEDPLLIPDRLSGGFKNYQEEATEDRFGAPVVNSAHEQIRGPQVEFDKNRVSVKVVQNRASLELPLLSSSINTVNEFPLWGVDARHVILSHVSWERKFYGQCYVYYERTLEFELRYDGFDKEVLDEGTKVLKGHWDNKTGLYVLENINGKPPVVDDPSHFIRYLDRKGNPAKVVLNGKGLPAMPIGSGAVGTAFLLADIVNRIDVINGGSGYTVTPTVLLEGGGGTGAVAHANTDGMGHITSFTIDQGGQDYTEAPNVVIVPENSAGKINVEKYDETDFLLLGIPTVF